MRKSQIASMDVIIAVMVFMTLAVFIFSYMFGRMGNTKLSELDRESDVLVGRLTSTDALDPSPIKIATSGTLEQDEIEEFVRGMLSSKEFYEDIKAQLNLKNDFCIHLETDDGNIVYLHELVDDQELKQQLYDENKSFPESVDIVGLGSENIIINDVPCAAGSGQ